MIGSFRGCFGEYSRVGGFDGFGKRFERAVAVFAFQVVIIASFVGGL
jgi:hypothetical protein